MENEEKTLSEQDRERIEQEAATLLAEIGARYEVDLFNDGTTHTHLEVNVRRYMVAMAEYEHKYQREQQAELRNKVIEECVAMICSTAPEYGPIEIGVKKVHELLNSLKTK